jgi:hypothetical protein
MWNKVFFTSPFSSALLFETLRPHAQSFGSAAAENPLLIYNWQPVFTGLDATADFVQNYYF